MPKHPQFQMIHLLRNKCFVVILYGFTYSLNVFTYFVWVYIFCMVYFVVILYGFCSVLLLFCGYFAIFKWGEFWWLSEGHRLLWLFSCGKRLEELGEFLWRIHWEKLGTSTPILDSMGFYGDLMGFNGILWWFNGIQWDFMVVYWDLMGFTLW